MLLRERIKQPPKPLLTELLRAGLSAVLIDNPRAMRKAT
jgi:hypothetical protein